MNEKTRRFQGRVFRCINIDGYLAWLPHERAEEESVSPISGRANQWLQRAKEFFSKIPTPGEAQVVERKQLIKVLAADCVRLQDEAARLQKCLLKVQEELWEKKKQLRQIMADSEQ